MLNVFCLAGRLAEDPVMRETSGGIRMAEVTLEVERPLPMPRDCMRKTASRWRSGEGWRTRLGVSAAAAAG